MAAVRRTKASRADLLTPIDTCLNPPTLSMYGSTLALPTPTDVNTAMVSPTPFGEINGKPIPAALAGWPQDRFFQRYRTSLVPAIEHDLSLLAFLKSPVNHGMISFLVEKTCDVIDVPIESSPPRAPQTPPATPARNGFDGQTEAQAYAAATLARQREQLSGVPRIPPLQHFIATVCAQSHVHTQTLMTTLIYLARLKEKLPKPSRGMACTRHRVFLAALIVASKYTNDQSPKNKHWARTASKLFSTPEINLMETQLLGLLDWKLAFTEDELRQHLKPFLHAYTAVYRPSSPLPSPTIMLHPSANAALSLAAQKIGGSPNSSFPTPPVTPMAYNEPSKQAREITPDRDVPTLLPLSWPSTGSSSASSSGPVTPTTGGNSSLLHARRAAKRMASALGSDEAMSIDQTSPIQFKSRATAEIFNRLVRDAMKRGEIGQLDYEEEAALSA